MAFFKLYKEICQMKECKAHNVEYFNFWNKLDIISIVLMIVSSFLDVINTISESGQYNLTLLQASQSLTQLVLGFRYMAYCRGIPSMSFMIRLMATIFEYVIGFLQIFFFLIIVFAASCTDYYSMPCFNNYSCYSLHRSEPQLRDLKMGRL